MVQLTFRVIHGWICKGCNHAHYFGWYERKKKFVLCMWCGMHLPCSENISALEEESAWEAFLEPLLEDL